MTVTVAPDGFLALQSAFPGTPATACDVTPQVAALVRHRLDKIRWEKELAQHGYERTRMSPELSEALRNEIRRALDNDGKPFDLAVARRVYDLAIAAKDMCAAATSTVSEAIAAIKDQNGPLEQLDSPDTPESQAQASETFGARLVREMLATFRGTQQSAGDDPKKLVRALADARQLGMPDVAEALEMKLFGQVLSGERPILNPLGSYDHGFTDGRNNLPPVSRDEPYHSGYLKGTEARLLSAVETAATDAVANTDDPAHVAYRRVYAEMGDDGTPDERRALFWRTLEEERAKQTSALGDVPRCREKRQCKDLDGSGACTGCGRWLGSSEPTPPRQFARPPSGMENASDPEFEVPSGPIAAGEVPVPSDPPLCATCVKDPDPRGGSSCYDCRQIRQGRAEVLGLKHRFTPRFSSRFVGPCDETCEWCGGDPRNTLHEIADSSSSNPRLPHAFTARATDLAGPDYSTCAHCGKAPRDRIHTNRELFEVPEYSSNGVTL